MQTSTSLKASTIHDNEDEDNQKFDDKDDDNDDNNKKTNIRQKRAVNSKKRGNGKKCEIKSDSDSMEREDGELSSNDDEDYEQAADIKHSSADKLRKLNHCDINEQIADSRHYEGENRDDDSQNHKNRSKKF